MRSALLVGDLNLRRGIPPAQTILDQKKKRRSLDSGPKEWKSMFPILNIPFHYFPYIYIYILHTIYIAYIPAAILTGMLLINICRKKGESYNIHRKHLSQVATVQFEIISIEILHRQNVEKRHTIPSGTGLVGWGSLLRVTKGKN